MLVAATVLTAWGALVANAQTPEQTKPDISNKALLVKPGATLQGRAEAGALHKLADDYYDWRNEQYPVRSSDAGLHTWDDRLTDYSPEKIAERALHVRALLDQVNAMPTANWPKDERIDWILFRSQLESAAFDDRVWHSTSRDPQTYVGECSNGIFSLLKKEYDTPKKRALAATKRLQQMPALLAQGEKNLQKPVKLFAELAIASARAIDPLFNESLMTLATDLSPDEKEELVKARDGALAALHAFADHLEKGLPSMVAFAPMGEENYNYYLHHILLLPLDAAEVEMIGRVELAQYRAYEAWLPDPSLADPDPKRSKNIPPDQASFLKAYESREAEMIRFLKDRRLITLPDYLGKFEIRQLPEAFKPTSPGGFMNPPGVYDKDPAGFYFIPTYNPDSKNFYIRAAIEDPRPILGHEGIPGHFLQLSIANHVKDEIRRQNGDNLFVEGWALYGEEMLMRQRPVSARFRLTGTGTAAGALSLGADWRGRESAHWKVDLRTGCKVFHGSRRTRSRSGRGRSSRGGLQPHSKNQLHHREVADHGVVRPLPRQDGEGFSPRTVPRRLDQSRQPAAIRDRLDHAG